MTNAEARFNNSLCPRKPEGSLGRTAQDGHLDSHTAPELWKVALRLVVFVGLTSHDLLAGCRTGEAAVRSVAAEFYIITVVFVHHIKLIPYIWHNITQFGPLD